MLSLSELVRIYVCRPRRRTPQTRDGPAAFLKDYRGYLQADAFNGYDGIYLESQGRIIEVACWAHARRKFHESRRLDAVRMETALAWIGKLYAVEKELRQRCAGRVAGTHAGGACRADRGRASGAVAAAVGRASMPGWKPESPKVLPKSPVRGAMDYTLNNWAALSVYPEDGWLDIDNNEGENSLRGLCIGRRNWLFCGSDRGGRAAAIHFSLLGLLQASRPRSLGLLPRRAHPAAGDASRGQRGRTFAAAAPLAAGLTDLLPSRQSRLDLSPTPSASSGVALALTDRDNKSHCGGQADPPARSEARPYPVFRRTLYFFRPPAATLLSTLYT